jgi:hypothetical protein
MPRRHEGKMGKPVVGAQFQGSARFERMAGTRVGERVVGAELQRKLSA